MTKFFAIGLILSAGLAVAQPTKIGIINLQQAVPATQEGQAAVAKLQRDFVDPATKKLEAMQGEIRDLTEKLQRGGNTLSETAKADQQRTIESKTKLYNRAVEDYQAESEEYQRKLLDDLSNKMRVTIDTYARDNNFAILFDAANPNSGLLWAANGVEITQAIIEAYDKSHPVAGGASAAPAKSVGGGTPAAVKPPAAPPAKPTASPAKPGTPAGK
ncbi:MAG: OmpH family outer membrane protein [Acidobacteriota bacterium]